MQCNLIKYFVFSGFFLLLFQVDSFSQDNKAIQQVEMLLNEQAESWNEADIDGFMESYWNSSELQFIGSKGVTFGWEQTLLNYKKSYPSKKEMGQLAFEIIKTERLSKKVMLMSGKFILNRQGLENLSGHFLLVWKKIKGEWKIIADHTS